MRSSIIIVGLALTVAAPLPVVAQIAPPGGPPPQPPRAPLVTPAAPGGGGGALTPMAVPPPGVPPSELASPSERAPGTRDSGRSSGADDPKRPDGR